MGDEELFFKVTISIFFIFISISSVLLSKSDSIYIPLIVGFGLCLSGYFEKKHPVFRNIQIVLLAIFHWWAKLNWCFALYIIFAAKEIHRIKNLKKSIAITLVYVSVYTGIRIFYSAGTLYNYLVMGSDVMGFMTFSIFIHYYVMNQQEKNLLKKEKKQLSEHDSLTGLLNFQEFHIRLDFLLKGNRRILLLILDCADLKSMNNEQGFQEGNGILVKIAEWLKIEFSEALLLSRYGGDEFAIAIGLENEGAILSKINKIFHQGYGKSNVLGLNLTFGYSIYPEDGSTKDELISSAEKELFLMKRTQWYKREEHVIRMEKLNLIGQLAAGMAHEVRNPLTTIKGFLQISKNNQYNIEPWYQMIMDEIRRMNELTVDFLQFSKPQASQFRIEPIHDCIQRVIHLMESKAILYGHEIKYGPHQTPNVLIDKDKMVQVLINLVQNAFECMPTPGIVTINLNATHKSAIIDIHDTGLGIDEGKIEHIFQPFYTTKETGTGLGLPICQKIIQDHGGTMEVSSTPQKGTTFSILLPLASSHSIQPNL